MAILDENTVPVVILHWKFQFYPSVPLNRLRNYLEETLLYVPRDDATQRVWLDAALKWKSRFREGVFKEMLREYHAS